MTERSILDTFQHAIAGAGLDYYLVPMADEFQSEYVPESVARLKFLTGFTGSAGLGIFRAKPTPDKKHALFVDGRYTLQAAREVDGAAIEIVPSAEISPSDWLAKLADGVSVGFDPWLVTQAQLEAWKKAAPQVKYTPYAQNIVDSVWGNRPSTPTGEVLLHGLDYTGKSYAEKRAELIETIKKHRADAALLPLADSVNWLLNIRGGDVPFNPLLLAQLVLKLDGTATLFAHPHTLSDAVRNYFAEHQVTIKPMAEVMGGSVSRECFGGKLLLDPMNTSTGWFTLAEKLGVEIIRGDDPAQLPKALKNTVELDGIRAAHTRDGLALTRFLAWFDTQIINGHFPDELRIAEKLEEFRSEDALYRGPSFATIAGSGPHGAIVHYRAEESNNRKPRIGELLLLDSGGQYPDGTTDVTRTMYVGNGVATPAPKLREHFTRVLKGHIALGAAKFPVGTSGLQLDVLARQHLWEVGLDFDHGTGHGVGAYLCVHEGPQRISKRGGNVALQPGMILSNEPGYYEAGHYGIRIENLVAVVKIQNSEFRIQNSESAREMLGFETLTLVPIDTRLIEIAMLTASERNWLNTYHQRVYRAHEGKLDDRTREWLMRATRAV